jgi:hypothetical protein
VLRVPRLTDLLDRHERLKKARKDRGFKTARAASEYLNIPYGTYSGHENGSRGIKDADIMHYASAFRVAASWLAFGNEKYEKKIKVVGVAGNISKMDDGRLFFHKDLEITPPFPVTSDARAILVTTDDYLPFLSEKDIALIGVNESVESLAGKRAALCHEGRILLGTLLSVNSEGRCHFQLFNKSVLLDIAPEWSAPIIGFIFEQGEGR